MLSAVCEKLGSQTAHSRFLQWKKTPAHTLHRLAESPFHNSWCMLIQGRAACKFPFKLKYFWGAGQGNSFQWLFISSVILHSCLVTETPLLLNFEAQPRHNSLDSSNTSLKRSLFASFCVSIRLWRNCVTDTVTLQWQQIGFTHLLMIFTHVCLSSCQFACLFVCLLFSQKNKTKKKHYKDKRKKKRKKIRCAPPPPTKTITKLYELIN